jgi:transcriptional regulator with XRE-family HTH domain
VNDPSLIAALRDFREATTPGSELALERRAAGFTVREVAKEIGVSEQYLGRWERRHIVTAATKKRYRAALARLKEKG